MKKNLLFICIILLLLYLLGCATAPKLVSGNVKEHVFTDNFKDTFSALVISLQDAQFQFQNKDAESGVIETEWKPESNLLAGIFVGKLHSKIKTTLTRLDDNHTKVNTDILVEKQTGKETWEPADLVREKDYVEFYKGVQENLDSLQPTSK